MRKTIGFGIVLAALLVSAVSCDNGSGGGGGDTVSLTFGSVAVGEDVWDSGTNITRNADGTFTATSGTGWDKEEVFIPVVFGKGELVGKTEITFLIDMGGFTPAGETPAVFVLFQETFQDAGNDNAKQRMDWVPATRDGNTDKWRVALDPSPVLTNTSGETGTLSICPELVIHIYGAGSVVFKDMAAI